MKKQLKLTFFLCALLASHAASAAVVNGKILNVGFHLLNRASLDYNQEGVAQITVAGLPPACGSGERRVVISTNNPLYNSMVSAALTTLPYSGLLVEITTRRSPLPQAGGKPATVIWATPSWL